MQKGRHGGLGAANKPPPLSGIRASTPGTRKCTHPLNSEAHQPCLRGDGHTASSTHRQERMPRVLENAVLRERVGDLVLEDRVR